MNKKIIFGVVMLVIISLALVACSESRPSDTTPQPPTVESEGSTNAMPPTEIYSLPTNSGVNDNDNYTKTMSNHIYITSWHEELLNKHPVVHNVDFLTTFVSHYELGDDYFLFSFEWDWGVIIWADAPMRDVKVIIFDYDEETESIATVVYYSHAAELVSMYELLVLNRFTTLGGVQPREGFSFVDTNGVRRYFAIAQDRRGDPGDPPYFLFEFENGKEDGLILGQNVPFQIDIGGEEVWGARNEF